MVPRFAREEDIIREITTLVAEPIKVDEFSLLRDEPVSVRVNCRDPSKIRNIVEIFFNGIGSDIKFIAKNTQGRTQGKGGRLQARANMMINLVRKEARMQKEIPAEGT